MMSKFRHCSCQLTCRNSWSQSDNPDNVVGLRPCPSTMESRFALRVKAGWWRASQRVGMALHRLANPVAPNHAYRHTIRATLSQYPGAIDIYFYVPRDCQPQQNSGKYPLLVNFHGGGFTLGCGTDDCRWFG